MALHSEERIGHATTDDDGITGADKTLQNTNLAGNLRTADDCNERLLRVFQKRAHELDFLLDQEPCIGGKIVCNTFGRSMCTVSSAEGIVHVYITK